MKNQKTKTFAERVYEVTKKIPKGKVATYKAIAEAMKSRAYRAVGNALNKNPYAPKVPCHRVIASDGSLGGFATGIERKKVLLRREGVIISNRRIDLQRFGCLPELLLSKQEPQEDGNDNNDYNPAKCTHAMSRTH